MTKVLKQQKLLICETYQIIATPADYRVMCLFQVHLVVKLAHVDQVGTCFEKMRGRLHLNLHRAHIV